MVGILSVKGTKVTDRRRVESILAGSGYRCVICGGALSEAEMRHAYQVKSSQPRCSRCGGYSVAQAYPTPEKMQADADFQAWRAADKMGEFIH
jgi:predicted SprT family Zn-dependent metalloprotease